MNEILICLIIAFGAVYVIDYTGFPKQFVSVLLTRFYKETSIDRIKLPKVLECSLCFTQWTTLIVLLIMNWKLCWLSFVFSWATKYILYVINLIDLLFDKLYEKIYNLISNI